MSRRSVIVVIDEIAWNGRFDAQIRHDWIDWAKPQFLGHRCEWESLLSLQKRPTGLPENLGATIRELDSITMVVQGAAFEFRIEKEICFEK